MRLCKCHANKMLSFACRVITDTLDLTDLLRMKNDIVRTYCESRRVELLLLLPMMYVSTL